MSVSKQFGVLSRFTAYLAIDRSQIANAGGKLNQVVQPVEAPAGWDRERGGGGHGGQVLRQVAAKLSARMTPPQARDGRQMQMGAPPSGAMPSGGAPPPPPPAQPPAARPPMPVSRGIAAPPKAPEPMPSADLAGPPGGVSYLVQLLTFAAQLEEQAARATPDQLVLRLVRGRLLEWAEDRTSTMNDDPDLVAAIEALAKILGASIAGTEVAEIAAALRRYARGERPPKPTRTFWK